MDIDESQLSLGVITDVYSDRNFQNYSRRETIARMMEQLRLLDMTVVAHLLIPKPNQTHIDPSTIEALLSNPFVPVDQYSPIQAWLKS